MARLRSAAILLASVAFLHTASTAVAASRLTPTPPVPLPQTAPAPAPAPAGTGVQARPAMPRTGFELPLELLVAGGLGAAGVTLRVRTASRR